MPELCPRLPVSDAHREDNRLQGGHRNLGPQAARCAYWAAALVLGQKGEEGRKNLIPAPGLTRRPEAQTDRVTATPPPKKRVQRSSGMTGLTTPSAPDKCDRLKQDGV